MLHIRLVCELLHNLRQSTGGMANAPLPLQCLQPTTGSQSRQDPIMPGKFDALTLTVAAFGIATVITATLQLLFV